MRASGILLPVSSLPGPYGIGCFSRQARAFVDWLADAGQTFWQILPLGPTGFGDSPYQSFSTFAGNPRPTLCIVDALLERVRPIGGGRHLKLRLEKGGVYFDCVMFSRREEELGAREGDRVDAAFYPQINEYHGQRSVQLLMTELRQTDTLPLCLDILEDRLPGPWTSSDLYPERSDFIRVWRWLERRGGSAGGEVSDLPGWRPGGMHPAKLLLCLRVMRDEGLVKARRSGDSPMVFRRAGVPMGLPLAGEYARFYTDQGEVERARAVLDRLNPPEFR